MMSGKSELRRSATRPLEGFSGGGVSGQNLYGTPFARAYSFGVFILLGVLLPAFFWMFLSQDAASRGSVNSFWPVAILLYSSWRIAQSVSRADFDIVREFFYAYLYVNFGIASLVQVITEKFPWSGSYDEWDVAYAYGLVFLGTFVMEVLLRWLKIRFNRGLGNWVSYKFTNILLCLVLFFGLLSIVIFFGIGWYSVLFSTRLEAGRTVFEEVGETALYQLLVRSMSNWSLLSGMILFLAAFRRNAGWNLSAIFWRGSAVFFMLFALVLANPLSMPRFWFATAFFAAAGLVFYRFFPRMIRCMPLLLVLGYLFAYPIADVYRSEYDMRKFEESLMYALSDTYVRGYTSGDFDSLQQIMNTVSATKRVGPQWGRQMVGTALFWVPRSLWWGKPSPTGATVAAITGYSYLNLSSPLWSEGYFDFHFFGVLIYLAGYAGFVFILYRASMIPGAVGYIFFAFSLVFAPYSVFLVRGALMSAAAYIAPGLLMALVLAMAARFLSKRELIVRRGPDRRLPKSDGNGNNFRR